MKGGSVLYANIMYRYTGSQVVLHYVFMGLDKTVQEYTGKDNTSELLELMQVLDKDGHPKVCCN